jgi:hypothetical protein
MSGDFQLSCTGYENEWRSLMNLKAVLRTYSLLRQLTDDETALLQTLRGMSDTERELRVESLQPEKTAAAKKRRNPTQPDKCGTCGRPKDVHGAGGINSHEFLPLTSKGKSSRASNMAATISRNLQAQRPSLNQCAHVGESGNGPVVCGEPERSPVHDPAMGYAGYHPFVSSSTARPAAGKSSTSDGVASSEIDSDDASVAVGAGSGGN